MTVLAIESASLVASAALLNEEVVLGESSLNIRLTHSQTLLPMIGELMEKTGLEGAALEGIALSVGPGSFTGLRIGAATAKGLATAWHKPVAAVSTLGAMAYQMTACRYPICPIMDARRQEVYTALYDFDERGRFRQRMAPEAMAIQTLLDRLAQQEAVLFTGDGLPVFQEIIRQRMGEKAHFAPPHTARQRAAAVGALGLELFRRGETLSAEQVAPLYLRPSQAERVRQERLEEEKS